MKSKLGLFGVASLANAALFLFLFIQTQFTPQAFVEGFGLQPSLASTVLCRRASMLFLGFAVLLFLSSRSANLVTRRNIAISLAATMFGFASMGILELARGTVNSSVVMAATVEIVFGALYLACLAKDAKTRNAESNELGA